MSPADWREQQRDVAQSQRRMTPDRQLEGEAKTEREIIEAFLRRPDVERKLAEHMQALTRHTANAWTGEQRARGHAREALDDLEVLAR